MLLLENMYIAGLANHLLDYIWMSWKMERWFR